MHIVFQFFITWSIGIRHKLMLHKLFLYDYIHINICYTLRFTALWQENMVWTWNYALSLVIMLQFMTFWNNDIILCYMTRHYAISHLFMIYNMMLCYMTCMYAICHEVMNYDMIRWFFLWHYYDIWKFYLYHILLQDIILS